ncbi:conserved hypothetical protein [Pseudomonas sp. IT-P218]
MADVLAYSRASPLPHSIAFLLEKLGLAREEASLGNTKPGQKKPPVNPLRIGDAAG